jgi:hypothetical protein
MSVEEPGMDLELLSASLRADSSDINAFVEGLATKLDEALPQRTRVERGRKGFRGPKVVKAITVDLGGERLMLSVGDRGAVTTSCCRLSGGIVLKTEEIGTDEWLDRLGRALATEAGRSEQTRQALERLLLN